MVEGQPDRATDHKGRLRANMWAEAKARHDEGGSARSSFGARITSDRGVASNGHVSRHVPTARQGKSAWVVGRPDLPHSWTDVGDVARALAVAATREDTWGQVWHVPSNEPRSQREALTDVLAAGDLPPVAVRGIPDPVFAAMGLVSPLMRELREMSYMFRRPYVLDSRHTEEVFGLAPTPWNEICRRTFEGN